VRSEAERYASNRALLQQMLQNTSDAMRIAQLNPGAPIAMIHNGVWQNLIGTFRYLGEAGGFSDAEGFPMHPNIRNFVLSANPQGEIYNAAAYSMVPIPNINIPNQNAQLADFMPRAFQNLRELGEQLSGRNDDYAILTGIREVREFIGTRFPEFAAILQNIATTDILDPGTRYNGNAHLTDVASNIFAEFIGGYINNNNNFDFIADLADVGIPAGALPGANNAAQLRSAIDVFLAIYDPVNPNINFTIPAGYDEVAVRNSVKNARTFGTSPQLAAKVGYFIREIQGNLYIKFGAMILNGKVTTTNNLYTINSEKFRKITPFFAVGISKNIDNNCGIIIELSHACKSKKELQNITAFGHNINNSTTISKSDLRIIVTYRF
jgi:hypothetical protein